MIFEKRGLATEIRAKGRRLEGYAATFNNPADIGGRFVETIKPGAFAASLAARSDILALVDHDAGRVLARTRSGTLRLAEDTRGLAFDLDLPDTSSGRDVLALAERGDIGGMSFGFTATDDFREGSTRELRAVDLHEISVVLAWPAYDGTIIKARSKAASHDFRSYAKRVLRVLELSR